MEGKKQNKKNSVPVASKARWSGRGYVEGGAKWGGRTGKMRREVREGGGFEDQVRWNTLVWFCQAGSVTQKELIAQTDKGLHTRTLF